MVAEIMLDYVIMESYTICCWKRPTHWMIQYQCPVRTNAVVCVLTHGELIERVTSRLTVRGGQLPAVTTQRPWSQSSPGYSGSVDWWSGQASAGDRPLKVITRNAFKVMTLNMSQNNCFKSQVVNVSKRTMNN